MNIASARQLATGASEQLALLEAKAGMRMALVANPYRMPFDNSGFAFSLMVATTKATQKTTQATITDWLHRQLFNDGARWTLMCSPTFLPENSSEWFELYRDDPDGFPTKNGNMGADLFSPILYGEELVMELRRAAEDFFGKGCLVRWAHLAREKQLRIDAQQAARNFANQRDLAIRKGTLNFLELAELREFLVQVGDLHATHRLEAIVALDGSGRPLGKALEHWFGNHIPVFYLDPDRLVAAQLTKHESEWAQLTDQFAAEFSAVTTLLRERNRSVLFVDDQIGYGRCEEAIRTLVQRITPGTQAQFLAMTHYNGWNQPSWWQKPDIQGIRQQTDRLTLLSEETPTSASTTFYTQLHEIVRSWRHV